MKNPNLTVSEFTVQLGLDHNDTSLANIVTWLRQVKRVKTSTFYLHYLMRKKNILVQAELLISVQK